MRTSSIAATLLAAGTVNSLVIAPTALGTADTSGGASVETREPSISTLSALGTNTAVLSEYSDPPASITGQDASQLDGPLGKENSPMPVNASASQVLAAIQDMEARQAVESFEFASNIHELMVLGRHLMKMQFKKFSVPDVHGTKPLMQLYKEMRGSMLQEATTQGVHDHEAYFAPVGSWFSWSHSLSERTIETVVGFVLPYGEAGFGIYVAYKLGKKAVFWIKQYRAGTERSKDLESGPESAGLTNPKSGPDYGSIA